MAPFLEFFYALRDERVPVTTHGWLALMRALTDGLHGESLEGFYQVARCLLCARESEYDGFDRAFVRAFQGVDADAATLLAQLDAWLTDPKRLVHLDPRLRAALEGLDLAQLRDALRERLTAQKRRHDGGNRWIGSGGTSPFGQGGIHPTGVRIGAGGGGRSALGVAEARRFAEHRRDLVLDTRQIAAALRRLRRLARTGADEELDLESTVDATARYGGELEVRMQPPRHNDVRVLLLMDVGGSMDPHRVLVGRLFSAAHKSGGFRELRPLYFHNCVYRHVYEDAAFTRPVATEELFRAHDRSWRLVLVGDAYMHPSELAMTESFGPSLGLGWGERAGPSGLTWLARLADHFPRAAWLNPERESLYGAPTIEAIARVFPMFPLTLDGIDAMVASLTRSMCVR